RRSIAYGKPEVLRSHDDRAESVAELHAGGIELAARRRRPGGQVALQAHRAVFGDVRDIDHRWAYTCIAPVEHVDALRPVDDGALVHVPMQKCRREPLQRATEPRIAARRDEGSPSDLKIGSTTARERTVDDGQDHTTAEVAPPTRVDRDDAVQLV